MEKLDIFQSLIDFFNSQFVSSMLGALFGGGIAVYVANIQNKQSNYKKNISYNENILINKKKMNENKSSYNSLLNELKGLIKF